MVRKVKFTQPLTTAQQLGNLIKSSRDIMRKDKGLISEEDHVRVSRKVHWKSRLMI
jgi:type I restriction enzyme M protein